MTAGRSDHSLLPFKSHTGSRRGHRTGPKESQSMQTKNEYTGHCFCGAVELRVVGKPEAMGYCHCTSCRTWSAGPVNAFTLWAPTAVTITRGADQARFVQQDPQQHSQVVPSVRRAPPDRASRLQAHRCVCRDAAGSSVRARGTRQLQRHRLAPPGRPAQAEGLPERAGGNGNAGTGVGFQGSRRLVPLHQSPASPSTSRQRYQLATVR